MDVREKMEAWRKDHGYSIEFLSKKSGISQSLLAMVEGGQVTHPSIAQRIGELYQLEAEEIYELMPKNRRPNDPEYDPDKYAPPEDVGKKFGIVREKFDEVENYISDHQAKAKRNHQRRGSYWIR